MSFLSELEQDPFDGHEFVERLAWRSTRGHFDQLDALLLKDCFESAIKDLRAILDAHQKKCDRLQMVASEEQKTSYLKLTSLHDRSRTALSDFEGLDSRLEGVSAKVVYLGDQLEGVNTPRARAVEAHKLMRRFAQFLDQTEDRNDDETDLVDSADVIQKLNVIAHELPAGTRFDLARDRIALKYDSVERELIEEFVSAHRRDDRTRMRQMAAILSHFKGYSQCVDAFIESAQSSLSSNHVFDDIPSLCARNEPLVRHVFPNADQVMSKLVLNVFHGRLQEMVVSRLEQNRDERHLSDLEELFGKTQKMAQKLEALLGSDSGLFLHKVTRNIFQKYLNQYIDNETRVLRDKCAQTLQRFYDSIGHQKRALSSYQELKRDLTAKIHSLPIQALQTSLSQESSSETCLLSEETAIAILQDTKVSLSRAQTLSRPQELSAHALQVFEICLNFLCVQHLDYALELSLTQSESSLNTCLRFLDTCRACNAICHLLEKQFQDSVLPLVANTPKHGECLKMKREISDNLEQKLNAGIERSLAAAVHHVRHLLASEQKKTDYKPDSDDVGVATTTQACAKVTRFVRTCVSRVRDCLDGRNVESVLTELGLRVHRTLFEHFQSFTFSIGGAMVAICDVNEYRKCAQEFRIPLLSQLFSVLHELFNLLIVAPDNLKHAMEEISLDRSVVLHFVQLRADYKTLRHQLRA